MRVASSADGSQERRAAAIFLRAETHACPNTSYPPAATLPLRLIHTRYTHEMRTGNQALKSNELSNKPSACIFCILFSCTDRYHVPPQSWKGEQFVLLLHSFISQLIFTKQNKNNYSSSLSLQFVLCIFTTHYIQLYFTIVCA